MTTVRQLIEKINISGAVKVNESMSLHTSYRIGGPADIFAEPLDEQELIHLLSLAAGADVPVFILGGGSNILVADRGIRGMVVSLQNLRGLRTEDDICRVGAGMSISDTAEYLSLEGWKGLESFYALPGSVGGAVWMNARCYDVSISDVLAEVTVLDGDNRIRVITPSEDDFAYKRSPFQENDQIILEAAFRLSPGNPARLRELMEELYRDREKKGHFRAPSAGSVFKNNRSFGRPSGAIIDSLGLRGYRVGDAAVSRDHANFIINLGQASAADVKAIIEHLRHRVRDAYGFELEPEVLLVGQWEVP